MSIAENIAAVRQQMDQAARETGRTGADIILVGASKMNDAAACQEAIAAGIDALGENRVQEMTAKLAENAYEGRPLHFIGHLQRNKVRQVVGKADLIQSVGSAELLQEIEKVDGIERIRFMTSHPKDLSDDLIEVMKNSKKICKHLHLPLQSGSSRLLKLMNRQYTKEHYLELVDKIRNTIPDISITTDIIVGFPGETEEDFEDTLDVVRKAKYDSAYTFIYSKRTGTPAAKMDGQVSEDIVKDRFNRLLATVSEVSHEHIKRYEGMDMDVLVEDIDDHDNTFVTGRMTNNILVHFKGDKELIGSIVNVHLDECKGFYYMGTKND